MERGFVKYGKVGRLGQQDTDGILNGTVYAMPKLDGTNGSVWVYDKKLQCGSRNRVLSAEADNAGFFKYVWEISKIPNWMLRTVGRYRLYGEWLVPHTLKNYVKGAWRRFYVFDVYDYQEGRWLTPPEFTELLEDTDIETLPYLELLDPSPEDVTKALDTLSPYLCEDDTVGEGIVLKNYEYLNKFAERKHAKFLCESFSTERGQKSMGLADVSAEVAIAERMAPEDLLKKTRAKVENKYGGWEMRYMPEYLETVWHDAIAEELYDALKKFKGGPLDVRLLRKCVYDIARRYVC